jgi:AcrR family transcriptional regulator
MTAATNRFDQEITAGADVAKGTFYLYFSSNEDILAALGDRFGQEHLARIKAALAEKPHEGWKEKLATWARACATGYLDSIQLHDLLFYGSALRRAKVLLTISSSIIFASYFKAVCKRSLVHQRLSFHSRLPVQRPPRRCG